MSGGVLTIDYAVVDGNQPPRWPAVRQAGVSTVIVRGTYGDWVDTAFLRDYDAIGSEGFVRGAYLFLRFPRKGLATPVAPDIQARAMVAALARFARVRHDLPPVIDLEFPGAGRSETGLSANQCLDWFRAAWRVLRDAYGVAPIIYTSARVWREDLLDAPAADLVESPLWLASYAFRDRVPAQIDTLTMSHMAWPATPRPWGDATNSHLHQYQGDALQFPGVSSTVDVSRWRYTRLGDTGDRVKWVQRRLGRAETGVYDSDFETVVKAFQSLGGLSRDGLVGPRTFAQLCWSGAERVA